MPYQYCIVIQGTAHNHNSAQYLTITTYQYCIAIQGTTHNHNSAQYLTMTSYQYCIVIKGTTLNHNSALYLAIAPYQYCIVIQGTTPPLHQICPSSVIMYITRRLSSAQSQNITPSFDIHPTGITLMAACTPLSGCCF